MEAEIIRSGNVRLLPRMQSVDTVQWTIYYYMPHDTKNIQVHKINVAVITSTASDTIISGQWIFSACHLKSNIEIRVLEIPLS